MNNNVINLFMWGFQQSFRISIKGTAESLFNQLDSKLRPEVFLIGVLVDERKDRHPICLEPEDCGYDVKAFAELKTLAKELEKADEEKRIFHSHPIAQANHDKRISNKAYIEAIRKILKREDLYGDTEKYVSYPTYIDGFLVFVILEAQRDALNSHYSLTKDKFDDRYTIHRSLIESVIDTYLRACSSALKDPEKSISVIDRSPDELIREAGRQFMYTASQAGRNFEGLHGLYDACNTIASLKYEGEEGLGALVIASHNHPNIKLTLQLEEPIRIQDFRKVRKFLELSNEKSLIVSDSALIYGLGEIRGKYNPRDESLFIIRFISHFKWELQHDNQSMMIVEYRQPRLPKELIDRDKFYSDLRRVFHNIENSQLDALWDITMEATKQSHGTMLVISDKAKQEAGRLGKQCFPLKPLRLDQSIIRQITSIDGSVLIDRDAVCYAVGVILDGKATDKGDSSRGARYNSAIRYYEEYGKDDSTVLVIISEDGMINLIPNLMPQIRHSLIIDAIGNFKELSEKNTVDRRSFNKLMGFFKNVEFYLSKEECEGINMLRKIIEEKDKDSDAIKIVFEDLKPNSEMNQTYYTDE
jgi:RNAse (barnase) inhibitor barstar